MRAGTVVDFEETLKTYVELPLFIRMPDFIARQANVDAARRRRQIRKNALIYMICGGATIGGAIAALLLGFFVAKGEGLVIVPSLLILGVGILIVRAGTSNYMHSFNTFPEANLDD